MPWVIETQALSKSYPREQSWRKLFSRQLEPPAVDRVDLQIAEGEIFGLVGPNGAGKTTLVKMLSTLVLPTAGQAWVCGHPLSDEQAVKSCVGLVTSDERSFYWRLRGRQNLEFFAVLQGLDFRQARQRAQEVLELVALQPHAERSFQTYSTGMRQRLAIARALLVQPRVLYLDEPTRGLDPQAQADLLRLIRTQLSRQQRITVLITSHNLSEIERLCDRIAIIQTGRIRACGSLAELRARFDPPAATQIELGSPAPAAILDSFQVSGGLQVEPLADGGARLTLAQLERPALNRLIDRLRQAGVEIQSIRRPEWGLDQIFNRLTKENLTGLDPVVQTDRRELPPATASAPVSELRATGWHAMLRVALAFLRRDVRMEASYRFSFFLQFFNIFFSVAVFYFIAQLLGPAALPYLQAYGGDYFSFVLIGIAFAGYFNVGLSSFANSLRTAQTTGTLEAMLSTPTRLSTIILSSSQWSYLMTTVRVLVYLALGSLFLGVNLENSNLFWSVCILLLTVLTFSSLGILAASFIMVLKRGDPVTWLFGTFSALLGGVYYPVEIMPAWLQALSAFLPITYALRAMRLALLQGAGWQILRLDLFVLALFAVVLLPASLAAFRYAVRRARQDGSLAHY